jgi:hypothetical protein
VLLTGPFGGLADDVRFRVLVAHRWPSILTAADPAEWRQALWSTALAPLAMLGAFATTN